MKNKIAILLSATVMFMLIAQHVSAQNGWQANTIYSVKGQTSTQTTWFTEYDRYTGFYYDVKYCRQLNWYEEYQAGQVYFWKYNSFTGQYYWASQRRQGNFWYCTWTGWKRC
jgi:hypothetical protein